METSSLVGDSESATHAGDDIATVADEPGTGSRADGNDCSFPPNANYVVHQRRRVNPESLAMRLGPDLVRDLDALITPGNMEMPSFAVRKELQERYNIDRRHIYDYFHSRGLRVVKEDKHGNPLTAKDLPTPLPNLRPLRQAPVKSARSHPPYAVVAERKLFKHRGITKAKPGRPKKTPPVNPKIVLVPICETDGSNESLDTNDPPMSENSPGEVPTPVYVTVNPLLPLSSAAEDDNSTFNSVANSLDESFSVRRAIGDVAYAYRYKPVFERLQELNECPLKLAQADDRSLSWSETSPCSANNKGLLLPHAEPLTQVERQAIYESVSDSLGPAQGIQECQGTYRKYMQARTKLYFEGLLSVPNHRSLLPAKTIALLDRKPSLGTNEFRHWLSETRFLKRDGANGSPRLQTNHRNTNVAKQRDADGADGQMSVAHWIPMLDDLFPAPGDMLDTDDTMTESPVVRRQVTHITTQAQGVANERSARGRLPFSATSTVPSLAILPITSVAETQRAGHAELHGHSGFPGTQEVKTLMPFSDAERHPQRPEHVACVSYPGQRLTLNDTQRRGRNRSNNTRIYPPSYSPRKPQVRDLDRVRIRPVTSRDARRRTPSAAGGI